MGNYIIDMFTDYVKKNWKWCLLITALLVFIKLWKMPYLSIATVTVCIWGAFIIVPIVAVITYPKSLPLYERFSEKLKLDGQTPQVKETDGIYIVSYVKNNMKVSTVFGDSITTYVMKKVRTNDEKRKKMNDETPADMGYYDASGVAVQKHVFISKSVSDIYRTVKKDVVRARRAFDEIGE